MAEFEFIYSEGRWNRCVGRCDAADCYGEDIGREFCDAEDGVGGREGGDEGGSRGVDERVDDVDFRGADGCGEEGTIA